MNFDFIGQVLEVFKNSEKTTHKAQLCKVEGFRLMVLFENSNNTNGNFIDEDVAEFTNLLNNISGIDFDTVRLYRMDNGNFLAVFVADTDRIKEVVDFGFEPFDFLL